MKNLSFLNPPPVYVEIGPDSLKVLRENAGVELPLERQTDGRLTVSGREKLTMALKQFLQLKSWQPRAHALCAIGARGVSLRRLSLPAGANAEFHRRLLLQIEAEFPLPPSELAWGCQTLADQPSANGAAARQELLVAAVKKELLADYRQILRACGLDPVFTLAALARRNLCMPPTDDCTLLDIGVRQSELTVFENGVPIRSRILFWGGENASGLTGTGVDTLAQTIKDGSAGAKVFVSDDRNSGDFTVQLARLLGHGWPCERLEGLHGEGRSSAIAGLKKFTEQGRDPSLILRVEPASGAVTGLAALDLKEWGLRAGVLAAACLLLPYAEALLLKPHLAGKVAAFQTEAVRETVIDRELDFLRNLKSSQPPYLETLYVVSKSAPPGTHFDALSLNSHGEVSLRGAFRDGQQVDDFRSKLIDSGFFANVTVEEQVPTPDRQRVSVRISAQEKSMTQLQVLVAGPIAEEINKDTGPAPASVTPPSSGGGMP